MSYKMDLGKVTFSDKHVVRSGRFIVCAHDSRAEADEAARQVRADGYPNVSVGLWRAGEQAAYYAAT